MHQPLRRALDSHSGQRIVELPKTAQSGRARTGHKLAVQYSAYDRESSSTYSLPNSRRTRKKFGRVICARQSIARFTRLLQLVR